MRFSNRLQIHPRNVLKPTPGQSLAMNRLKYLSVPIVAMYPERFPQNSVCSTFWVKSLTFGSVDLCHTSIQLTKLVTHRYPKLEFSTGFFRQKTKFCVEMN